MIAVDGPAGSGKSSAARGVARELGLRYLDTGAMYRALTWWLIAQQRDILARACAAGQGIVAEGRDIGTVVAPQAPVKVFLTASEEARAVRRSADLATDPGATPDVTRAENKRRDRADSTQTVMAADAIEVDSTVLSLDEVIGLIVRVAGERGFSLRENTAPGSRADTARLS